MGDEVAKIAQGPSPILNVPQPGGLSGAPKPIPAAPISSQKIIGKAISKIRDTSRADWSAPQPKVATPALDAPGSDIPVPAVGA
jgi:hypothetical protein